MFACRLVDRTHDSVLVARVDELLIRWFDSLESLRAVRKNLLIIIVTLWVESLCFSISDLRLYSWRY